jgi:hypothetical protein
MSGSGSSLFSVCDDMEAASSQARRAQDALGVGAIAVTIAPLRGSDADVSI